MAVPSFLLRKLYKRHSLVILDDSHFAFSLHNRLGNATLLTPPAITVNGVHHPPSQVDAGHLQLAEISEDRPFTFRRGTVLELHLQGQLMKSNRIHIRVMTKEFDDIDFLVEDQVHYPGDEEE